jgi:hypothetical protein
LEPFTVRTLRADLEYLLELVTAEAVDPQIGLRTSREAVADAAGALLDRTVAGNAVLELP